MQNVHKYICRQSVRIKYDIYLLFFKLNYTRGKDHWIFCLKTKHSAQSRCKEWIANLFSLLASIENLLFLCKQGGSNWVSHCLFWLRIVINLPLDRSFLFFFLKNVNKYKTKMNFMQFFFEFNLWLFESDKKMSALVSENIAC